MQYAQMHTNLFPFKTTFALQEFSHKYDGWDMYAVHVYMCIYKYEVTLLGFICAWQYAHKLNTDFGRIIKVKICIPLLLLQIHDMLHCDGLSRRKNTVNLEYYG